MDFKNHPEIDLLNGVLTLSQMSENANKYLMGIILCYNCIFHYLLQ